MNSSRRILFILPALIILGVVVVLLVWPEKAGTLTFVLLLLALAVGAMWGKEKEK